uniref:MAM domain-containing protein n=1 Tax=Caenorhabditis japonica TaxID=281687 RepID=A0A8R1I0V2_CAEJA
MAQFTVPRAFFAMTLAYIEEDICPQREGYDLECDVRCGQLYPMRIGSGCRTRQTGQLLSFFGIQSFVCTCHLSPIACANPQFAVHPYHTLVVQQHSMLTPIAQNGPNCKAPRPPSLWCQDPLCSWQYSREFEWYSARPNGQARPLESPEGQFLAGTSHQGATWATISTCDALCASTSVNLTARVWRPPTVMVELCFKEKETTMCAPVHASNGHLINEIIPETSYFQIMLRFSNVTAGEMILLDELALRYQPCQKKGSSLLSTNTTTSTARAQGLPISSLATAQRSQRFPDSKLVQHRMCQNGKCPSTITSSTTSATKMCVGRPGLAYCRQKCKALEAAESSARCLRQRENPLIKKCICHVRRAPVKLIEGPDQEVEMNRVEDVTSTPTIPPTIETESTTLSTTIVTTTAAASTAETTTQEVIILDKKRPEIPLKCEETNCNFEKGTKCGWADLRMLSRHFNNISVAMKKGDENRYGISRLEPKTYSGLLYKAPLIGPIQMSIDVFPSHEIDVRICVQNLRKCQTQTIAARNWNRISARIKVQSTEKIFVLFYNSEYISKSIAIDNILVKNGACI